MSDHAQIVMKFVFNGDDYVLMSYDDEMNTILLLFNIIIDDVELLYYEQ